jgi:hypothetical protein
MQMDIACDFIYESMYIYSIKKCFKMEKNDSVKIVIFFVNILNKFTEFAPQNRTRWQSTTPVFFKYRL